MVIERTIGVDVQSRVVNSDECIDLPFSYISFCQNHGVLVNNPPTAGLLTILFDSDIRLESIADHDTWNKCIVYRR
jgi:hypothetical protein